MRKADAKAKARITATRQMLEATRVKGFRTTGSALDAIYGNLATTQKGIAASQTVANARTAAALERISGRTDRRVSGIARRTGAAERNLFGSVAGAAADRASGALEAGVKASRAVLGSELKAGATGIKGAADTLGIVRAGAAEARAGAKGQLADALQYRAQQDAQIVAGMQQARMEANLQFQTWKRQQDYLAKQEQKAAGGELGGLVQATNTTATAGAYMRRFMAENPGATAPEALKAYQDKYGVLEAATPLLTLVSQSVYASVDPETGQTRTGYDRTDETHDLVNALHTLYPNFGKQRDAVRRTIDSALAAGYADVAAKAAETAHPDFSAPANEVLSGPVGDQTGQAFGQNADSVQAGIETGATVTTQKGDPAVAAANNTASAQKAVQDYSRNYWSTHKDTPANRAKLEKDPTYAALLAKYQAALDAENPF